jgi:hypothetical protein
MLNSLAISALQSAPFNIRRIQQGKQMLNRAHGRFRAVINGRCLLDFAENVALSFDWVAVGQSDEQSMEFTVHPREGYFPQLDGTILVDDTDMTLSWRDQGDTLLALVDSLNWQDAVKESLAKTYLVGADL